MFFRTVMDKSGVRLLNVTVPQTLSLASLIRQVAPNIADLDGLDNLMSVSQTAIVQVPQMPGNASE